MSSPVLGHVQGDGDLSIDVERLVQTRALLTANSGAGKSWALRRLLEQTHGRVQQLVVAEVAGYEPGTGSFQNALGRLRTLGCIDYPDKGHAIARGWLFLEGGP